MNDRLPARLRELLDAPPEDVRLAEVALLLSEAQRPGLDVEEQLGRLDDIARAVSERLPPDADAVQTVLAINQHIFHEMGFSGAGAEYYDPRNSFLDEVLTSKRGIPITLAILYIDIGRQLGLALHGVAFPGHFLVRCEMDDGVVIIDPYGGGATLDREDLQSRLRETRNGEVADDTLDDMLVPASPRDVAARMLRNLKAIHLRAKHYDLALPILDWLVEIVPDDAVELRDRGRVFEHLECFRAAVGDYARYLEQVPDADDNDAIRSRVVDLQRAAARLN
jgi:regulator of sirC expression with transglutaminase-like and TPR domain